MQKRITWDEDTELNNLEELEVAASMYDDFLAGIFYEKHEQALHDIVDANIGILNKEDLND